MQSYRLEGSTSERDEDTMFRQQLASYLQPVLNSQNLWNINDYVDKIAKISSGKRKKQVFSRIFLLSRKQIVLKHVGNGLKVEVGVGILCFLDIIGGKMPQLPNNKIRSLKMLLHQASNVHTNFTASTTTAFNELINFNFSERISVSVDGIEFSCVLGETRYVIFVFTILENSHLYFLPLLMTNDLLDAIRLWFLTAPIKPTSALATNPPQAIDELEADYAPDHRDPLNVNTEESLCSACGVCCPPGDGVLLKNCSHNFCIQCLQASIRSEVFDVKCPNHVSTGCIALMTTEELKELIAPYELNLLMKNKNSFDVTLAPIDIHQISDSAVSDDEYYDAQSAAAVENNITNINNEPEDELLQRLNDLSYDQNYRGFTCSLCFKLVAPLKGIVLRVCFHEFCMECLLKHIHTIDNISVKCPFTSNLGDCEQLLQQLDMRAILPATKFNHLLAKSLMYEDSENITLVPNDDKFACSFCMNACDVGDGIKLRECLHEFCVECIIGFVRSSDESDIKCPYVNKSNENCESIIHEQEVRAMESVMSQKFIQIMISNGNAMLCPQCQAVISKDVGCDAITCTVCDTDICWVTKGRRWGPMGQADTSAGCRCGVGGKRCHPNCNNCH